MPIEVVLISKGKESALKTDSHNTLVVINRNHYEIHHGEFFTVSHIWTDVANEAAAGIRVQTNEKELHIGFSIDSEGKTLIKIYEDTTFSGSGTALQERNNYRKVGDKSSANFFYTPTVDDAGTEFFETLLNGGTGPKSTGGGAKGNEEWIFKPGTEYYVEAVNDAGSAKDISITIEFYEESV